MGTGDLRYSVDRSSGSVKEVLVCCHYQPLYRCLCILSKRFFGCFESFSAHANYRESLGISLASSKLAIELRTSKHNEWKHNILEVLYTSSSNLAVLMGLRDHLDQQ